jgi:hypothetical protein
VSNLHVQHIFHALQRLPTARLRAIEHAQLRAHLQAMVYSGVSAAVSARRPLNTQFTHILGELGAGLDVARQLHGLIGQHPHFRHDVFHLAEAQVQAAAGPSIYDQRPQLGVKFAFPLIDFLQA